MTITTSPSTPTHPPFDPIQEVRFAVVMYGGVSLAIYINGVAQELLKLARATAPSKPVSDVPTTVLVPHDDLTGSERVYRKLGQLLGGGQEQLADVKETDPVRTRFVIDVLSGTSAGGINAIFLAKALANDQKIDRLKQLWIEEGDIARLINDAHSVTGVRGLNPQHPPQSLLNSQRMYRLLLDAFEGMEAPARSRDQCHSPYVEELDLFVTATDILGLTLPIRLADRVVCERRHRNVFHFLYATAFATGGDHNDFHADNNPFLAFAARATSSFPFAFEPMTLRDLDDLLASVPAYRDKEKFGADSERWKAFFKDYLMHGGADDACQTAVPMPHSERAFGDGGYLDNKPFSYATETLLRRRADVPVDRKLIYIEPSPEHPELERLPQEKPDVVENVAAAVLTLPRYETIREDLERVVQRNRLIERVERVLQGHERDVESHYPQGRPQPPAALNWAGQDLRSMVQEKGFAYGVYHRLKIAALTDELAGTITRVAGFDEKCDQFLAIRYLVRAWRDAHYVEYHKDEKPTQNRLLLDFDLSYRLRRLSFVRTKIDQIYPLDARAREIMKWAGVKPDAQPSDEQRKVFQEELRVIKRHVNGIYVFLRRSGRRLRSRHNENPLRALIADLGITSGDLLELLSKPTDRERETYAYELLQTDGREAKFQKLADEIVRQLKRAMVAAARSGHRALDPASLPDSATPSALAARQCLWHYYQYYDDYDMLIFPIQQGTELGEADTVEVIRISPEDAKKLIDEERSGCRKLAGTALSNFGAFLERLWRENDMLWGQLDAAERIITALLPNCPHQAKQLISEAQAALISEAIQSRGKDESRRLLVEAFMRTRTGDPNPEALRRFIQELKQATGDPKLVQVLNPDEMLDYYRRVFEEDRRPDPEATLRSLARATQVVGTMLEGLADRYALASHRIASSLTLFGRLLWRLVEVAVPRSFKTLVFRYWLNLLYLFELFLIGGGILLGFEAAQKFGLIALALTVALDLVPRLLGAFLRGKKTTRRALMGLIIVVVAIVILLAALGVSELFDLIKAASDWVRRWLRLA
jgi:patatin-related protein